MTRPEPPASSRTRAPPGCDTLYSEDLQDGRSIGGLAIVNPFGSA